MITVSNLIEQIKGGEVTPQQVLGMIKGSQVGFSSGRQKKQKQAAEIFKACEKQADGVLRQLYSALSKPTVNLGRLPMRGRKKEEGEKVGKKKRRKKK